MQQVSINALDYKARQYWAVDGVFDHDLVCRLKYIPSAYYSRSKRCWLILRSLLSKSELESVLIQYDVPAAVSFPTELPLNQMYQSAWRNVAPYNPKSPIGFRMPKSAKYRCMLRMLYSHDLSIRQICMIELSHISWGEGVLEIQVVALAGNKLVLSRVTSQLVTDYIRQAQPERYLFETQPGLAYPEEKLHRCLIAYVPAKAPLQPRQYF